MAAFTPALAAGVRTAKSLRESPGMLLRRKIRTAIVAGLDERPKRQRYFHACRRINEVFGYDVTGRPTRCGIGKVRWVQLRQHAVLAHSAPTLEQLRRVDRTVRRWLRREFGSAHTRWASGRPRSRDLIAWRVRSAARMYEMEVAANA